MVVGYVSGCLRPMAKRLLGSDASSIGARILIVRRRCSFVLRPGAAARMSHIIGSGKYNNCCHVWLCIVQRPCGAMVHVWSNISSCGCTRAVQARASCHPPTANLTWRIASVVQVVCQSAGLLRGLIAIIAQIGRIARVCVCVGHAFI